MEKIYVIGVGLIGGSLVLDIKRQRPAALIYGVDNNEAHLKKALDLKIIDKVGEIATINEANLVVLAIPVDASVELLPKLLDLISDEALIIDVGSTKQNICKAVENHPKRRNFLAMHPIAGTEFSGPEAALPELFNNKTNIICEVEKTGVKLQKKALELFTSLGMNMRYMNPETHDKQIAYVSHLSHISAFMLGKTVIEKEKNERDIFDMAGSGFASTVRLAKSSPEMWTPIFKQNKLNVIETLQEYILNLTEFKNKLKNDDFEGVFNIMENTNYIKQILNGIE